MTRTEHRLTAANPRAQKSPTMGAGVSLLEAVINASVGLVVSWAVTFYALPLWGLTPSASASVGITAMYFLLSFARAFLIREGFRKWAS